MEIVLTYEGRIPSKGSNLAAVWQMRKSFDTQLRKLWGKPPFDVLKKWEDSNFSGGAPNFLRACEGHTFVPLYGADVGVGVDLNIQLLTGMPAQKRVVSAGDLDNRIKRIIDALQAPTQKGEMIAGLPPGQRWYCLVENDSAVLGLRATLGAYLGSEDPSVSFATIVVKPIAMKVTLSNLAMLF